MSNPEQQSPPPPFTAEQIYTLVDRRGNDEDRQALAQFFDSMPVNHGGVAMYETDRTEKDEALLETPLICFNGQLDQGDAAGLRQADEGVIKWVDNKYKPSLNERQKETKQPVKSLPKRLGAIGVSGAAGGGVGVLMDVFVPEGVAFDTTFGVIAAGAAYFIAWPFAKQRQIRDAKQRMESLKTRCLDTEQGAIRFLRDKRHIYGLPPRQEAEAAIAGERAGPEDTLIALWNLTETASQFYSIYGNIDAYEKWQLQIKPGQLIKTVLMHDEEPDKFWHGYLGEQARELSSLESQIERAETEKGHLERIKALAGRTDEKALKQAEQELQAHRQAMAEKAYEIVLEAEKRAEVKARKDRLAETEKFFNKAASGEVDEAHEYEMALQTLRSIVLTCMGQLDFAEPSTLDTAKDVNAYLQGVRAELRTDSEMQYFYVGLHGLFSKRLPGLPKWEDAEKHFLHQPETPEDS